MIAGSVWAAAGLMLIARALLWMTGAGPVAFELGACGLGVGILKAQLVFVPMARRNIERINALAPHKERVCVFAFQAVESYLVVGAMITLGILLRMSPLPRLALATVYTAIGSALFLASRSYLVFGLKS